MSYATVPTFEGTRLGIRRLGVLSGIGGEVVTLGDAAGTASALIATGWNASLINGLLQAGATDQQLTDLMNGATDPTQILYQLKLVRDSSLAVPAGPDGGLRPTNPAVASGAPQSPQGSTLLYIASWTAGFGNIFTSPNAVISQLVSALGARGMAASGVATGSGPITYGIQVRIQDNIGHATLADIQSILHPVMIGLVGNNLSGENLSLVAYPGQPVPPGTPGTTDFSTWFQNNWVLVAGGFAALVIGLPLVVDAVRGRR